MNHTLIVYVGLAFQKSVLFCWDQFGGPFDSAVVMSLPFRHFNEVHRHAAHDPRRSMAVRRVLRRDTIGMRHHPEIELGIDVNRLRTGPFVGS